MNQNKNVRCAAKVPFSWEKKPGVSKKHIEWDGQRGAFQLPPPPCRKEIAPVAGGVPLPPCTFQVMSTRKGSFRKLEEEDPFVVALKECRKNKKGLLSKFSCKHSCSVADDSFLRTCRLPYKRTEVRF